jgi:hypothetical protein
MLLRYMQRKAGGCSPWRWYRGVGRVHTNRGRVGEERGGKNMDICPLTVTSKHLRDIECFKAELHKRFDISDLGELTWLLGLKVE